MSNNQYPSAALTEGEFKVLLRQFLETWGATVRVPSCIDLSDIYIDTPDFTVSLVDFADEEKITASRNNERS